MQMQFAHINTGYSLPEFAPRQTIGTGRLYMNAQQGTQKTKIIMAAPPELHEKNLGHAII